MKIRIETIVKNGVTSKHITNNGVPARLYDISRALTGTVDEEQEGIFTTGTVDMKNSVESHTFTFTSEMSYQERVNVVRSFFQRNDHEKIEEFELV